MFYIMIIINTFSSTAVENMYYYMKIPWGNELQTFQLGSGLPIRTDQSVPSEVLVIRVQLIVYLSFQKFLVQVMYKFFVITARHIGYIQSSVPYLSKIDIYKLINLPCELCLIETFACQFRIGFKHFSSSLIPSQVIRKSNFYSNVSIQLILISMLIIVKKRESILCDKFTISFNFNLYNNEA